MKKKNSIIKSSKLSIKFANSNKKKLLSSFIDDYRLLVIGYVDILWDMNNIPNFLPKEITDSVLTTLSSRIKQCAGKQASSIVRGTRKKQEQRMWMIKKLEEQGKFKQARKLEAINKKKFITKPTINEIECELDERFIKQDFNNISSFDGWITISSIGNKQKIIIPVKRTKHFNKLEQRSNSLLNGIRLSKNKITFNFKLETPEKKTSGSIIGIDVGHCNVISCSNGFQTVENNHGHNLSSINKILSRKKKGSVSFKKTQQHRKNYINWCINQLNLSDVKEVRIENIKNLRLGRRSSRLLSHWTYTEIFEKLESYCSDAGVQIKKVSPTYTSQRCSTCGRVRKGNRKGKQFTCDSCGHKQDSDLNASLNISFELPQISKEVRLLNLNRSGFFWLESGFFLDSLGLEPIVPNTLKVKNN